MSRYIEYEPLMAELEREVELADDWKTAHEIANVAKYAPTIDIVFCKECKHWTNGDDTYGICYRCANTRQMRYDDFCSYGERDKDINVPNKRQTERSE